MSYPFTIEGKGPGNKDDSVQVYRWGHDWRYKASWEDKPSELYRDCETAAIRAKAALAARDATPFEKAAAALKADMADKLDALAGDGDA